MANHTNLTALMNEVVLDSYARCVKADLRVKCESQIPLGTDQKEYRRITEYFSNGRAQSRAEEIVQVQNSESAASHTNEVCDSLERTLARHGVTTKRDGSTIEIDTQGMHRARYSVGEIADMFGVAASDVVNAYRKRHGREPSGRYILSASSIVEFGLLLRMQPEQIVAQIETYHALRAMGRTQ
jgi:hypothetical protein